MKRTSIVLVALLVLLGLIAQACGNLGSRRRSDDDDSAGTSDDDDSAIAPDDDDDSAVTPDDDDVTEPPDDDDSTGPLGPYEGEWSGGVTGVVRFGVIEYDCAGEATVSVDGLNFANGTIACEIQDNPGQYCNATVPNIVLGAAPLDHPIDCTGLEFPGSLTIVSETFLQGSITGTIFDEGLGYEVEVSMTYSLLR